MADAPEASPIPVSPEPIPEYKAVTPWWHTVMFLALLLAVSFAGAREHKITGSRMPQYLFTMGWEWFLFFFVMIFARRRGTRVRDLIGGKWKTAEDGLLDVVIAVGFWVTAVLVLALSAKLMGLGGSAAAAEAKSRVARLGFLAPITPLEMITWTGLTLTAGWCEEIIFRGYLYRQFAAATKNVWIAMVASSLVFGIAHGYQGASAMILIAIYGMLFSLLVHFRKSLRPGMMAHAWHDFVIGMLLSFLVRHPEVIPGK